MTPTPQYALNQYLATSGYTADDGRLTDGSTAIGSGWEATGGSTAGSRASVSALYDLGASPLTVTAAVFTVAWEGTISGVLETSNDMSNWTTQNTITSPNHNGTYSTNSVTLNFSPSVTARYWRLSVQDTSAGGTAVVNPGN